MYRVIFDRKAVKELKKIDVIWQRRIKDRIELLAENPAALKPNIKKLRGKYNKLARLRVGNYRIIFKVIDKKLVILIIRIAHRKEVY